MKFIHEFGNMGQLTKPKEFYQTKYYIERIKTHWTTKGEVKKYKKGRSRNHYFRADVRWEDIGKLEGQQKLSDADLKDPSKWNELTDSDGAGYNPYFVAFLEDQMQWKDPSPVSDFQLHTAC